MGTDTQLLIQLVAQAATRRREAEQHFRSMIFAASAAGVPLAPIAEAADLSVSRVHAIIKQEGSMPLAPAAPATHTPSKDVLVVAAKNAYDEYLDYCAYVCQRGRGFRDVDRMGFYRLGKIEPHFPRIIGIAQHVDFTPANVERLRATGSPVDREVARIVETLLKHRKRRDGEVFDVFVLSSPDHPDTLTLDQPIKHRATGRGSAWTMGQRYIAERSLENNPTTTDDLA